MFAIYKKYSNSQGSFEKLILRPITKAISPYRYRAVIKFSSFIHELPNREFSSSRWYNNYWIGNSNLNGWQRLEGFIREPTQPKFLFKGVGMDFSWIQIFSVSKPVENYFPIFIELSWEISWNFNNGGLMSLRKDYYFDII